MTSKKKMVTLVGLLLALFVCVGMFAFSQTTARADEPIPAAPKSIKLYQADSLVTSLGGRKMTIVNADGSDDDHKGGTVTIKDDSGAPFGNFKNNGWIQQSPASQAAKVNYGYDEYWYISQCWGFNNKAFEIAINEPIQVSDTPLFTFKIGVDRKTEGAAPDKSVMKPVFGKTATAKVYAYGESKTGGNIRTQAYTVTFTVGTFTPIYVDLSNSELKTVTHIAVNPQLADVENLVKTTLGNDTTYHADLQMAFADFGFTSACESESELTVNDTDYDCANGAFRSYGIFGDYYDKNSTESSVYNAAYKPLHVMNIQNTTVDTQPDNPVPASDKKYYANRISYNTYVAINLARPVNKSACKYLDIMLKTFGQGAEGAWLAEDCEEFRFKILSFDADETAVTNAKVYTAVNTTQQWHMLRVPLADLSGDANGYIGRFYLLYIGSEKTEARGEDAGKYSMDILLYNFTVGSKFHVTFDTVGGSAVASESVAYGGKVTKPADPVKSGYTFVKWVISGGDTEFDFATPVTDNIALTAVWALDLDHVLQYPMGGLNLVTATVNNDYSLRLQGADPDVYGYDIWYNEAVITSYQEFLQYVTLTRGETAYTCTSVIHNGAGVIYGFDLQAEYLPGDTFTVAEEFRLVLPENERYSQGKGTRVFEYGKKLRYMYDGSTWLEMTESDAEYDDTVFTYLSASVTESADMTVTMKSAVPFYFNEPDPDLLGGIAFNGKSLATLMEEGKATVAAGIFDLKVTLPKTLFAFDGKDTVTIAKGKKCFMYPSEKALVTRDDETFVYSAKLNRFELVPVAGEDANRYVTVECVQYAGKVLDGYQEGDYYGYSLWITFMAKNSHYGLTQMQSSLDTLMTGRKKSNTSDMINYEMARRGVFKSVMDGLFINGKTVREWMEADAAAGNGEVIKVDYLNGDINGGKVLRIQAATVPVDSMQRQVHSLLGETLGCEKAMTVKIAAGFTTPSGLMLAQDMCYEIGADEFINLTTDDEAKRGVETRFRNVTENKPYVKNEADNAAPAEPETEGGCSGTAGASAGFIGAFTAAAVIWAICAKKREDEKNA